MIPDQRLQSLISSKDFPAGHSEGWAIVDGCLIVYDLNDCPKWIADQLESRDDDGNTAARYDADLRTAVS